MTKPKKVIKLATQGQVRGFKLPDSLDGDYEEAAKLAKEHPGHPVIVHEYPFPDDAAVRESVRTDCGAVAKAQMHALNAELPVANFHVGYSIAAPPDLLYRTFVTWYPDGRPKRTRKRAEAWHSGLDAELEAATQVAENYSLPGDPPLPPEDDPDAPRGQLSGSGFVYPATAPYRGDTPSVQPETSDPVTLT